MSNVRKLSLASLALAGLSAVASGPALAGGMTVDSNGGFEIFELDNTDYWFKIGGRLHLDHVWYEGGEYDRSKFPSGSHIRRARVTLKGGVGNDWVYKLDLDYADRWRTRLVSTANPELTFVGTSFYQVDGHVIPLQDRTEQADVYFGEAFVAYNGCKNFWIALGQVSIPFGFEAWSSSNDIPFMELSMPSQAFTPTYGLGAYVEWHSKYFTFAGAVYNPPAGTTQTGDQLSAFINPATGFINPPNGPIGSDPGSDPLGFAARLTFSPVHDDYAVYHVGASARYQNLHDHANVFNFFAGMEAKSRQAPVMFTNIPRNSAHDYVVYGFELAGRWGPFSAQAEYMMAEVDREGNLPLVGNVTGLALPAPFLDPRSPGGDLKYHGYYAALSYVITGEAKEYDFVSGTFGRVRPKSSKGAWEILARHSYVDLIDNTLLDQRTYPPIGSGIQANDTVGSAHATTLGITWWVNDNVRFLGNYVRTNLPNTVDINAIGLSAQVKW